MKKTNLEEKIDKVKSGLFYVGLATPALGLYKGFMDGMGLRGDMLPQMASMVIGPTIYGALFGCAIADCDPLDTLANEIGGFSVVMGMGIGGAFTVGCYGAGYYVASLMK